MAIPSEDDLRAVAEAAASYPTKQAAADSLTLPISTFKDRLKAAARKGIAVGHVESGVAPGYLMGKVTFHRKADGTLLEYWDRQHPADEPYEDLVARMAERAESLPVFPRRVHLAPNNDKLANLFHYHDFHLGMKAWHREGDADWDLAIAARIFRASLADMMARAPKADTAILVLNGDFYHANGTEPVTPRSKNVLDVDNRWEKVKQIGMDLICDAIDVLLDTHPYVKVLPIEGNHDQDAMVDLRVSLRRMYRDNPRLWVNDSPLPYVAIKHGKVMLAFHHGHLKKNAELTEVFVSGRFREMWGQTEYTYIHTGHRHHKDREKGGAAEISQHSTLAARDAHASRGGYVADRSASVITYHEDWGVWNEAHLPAAMLEMAA